MTTEPRDDVDVPRFLAELGIPGLADIHVHFLPERMLAKVWDYFDQATAGYGRAWPITYRFDTPTRLRIARELGLARIPALTYPHKPGMAAWLNDWNAEFAASAPDILHCATLYPEPGVGEYVARAIDSGARLFKVHIQVGAFSPADPLLDPAWEALAAARLPVVIHAGSAPRPGRHTGPEAVARVLADHPELRLVIAHMGMPEYHAFADLAEQYPGVHLDTTMFNTGFTNATTPFDAAYRARLPGLRERIVLGSDFPNIPYPYSHQLQALCRLGSADEGFGDDWLRAVLWDNGARLMGIDGT